MLKEPEALLGLAEKGARRMRGFAKGPLAELVDDLKTLLRLLKAYAKGDYREIPLESMVIIVGAVLYVVSPIDIIPDALPGGLLDDASVLAFALKMVNDELEDFKAWEDEKEAAKTTRKRG
jgi:uncharacterized membrane protein YkvA (DUF1232 family)